MPTVLFSSSAWWQPKTSSVVELLCARHGKNVSVKKNTQLLDAGFDGQDIYLLRQGGGRFVYHDSDGAEITLSFLLPGRSAGDFSVVVERRIMFNLEVLQDSTFQMISRTVFVDYLTQHPEAREEVEENVRDRYRSYLEGFYSNAYLNSERRLAKFFEYLTEEPEIVIEDGLMCLPSFLTQALIASALATNPVSIHKLVQKWKQEKRLVNKDGAWWVNLSLLQRHENPFAAQPAASSKMTKQ